MGSVLDGLILILAIKPPQLGVWAVWYPGNWSKPSGPQLKTKQKPPHCSWPPKLSQAFTISMTYHHLAPTDTKELLYLTDFWAVCLRILRCFQVFFLSALCKVSINTWSNYSGPCWLRYWNQILCFCLCWTFLHFCQIRSHCQLDVTPQNK